MAMLRGAAGGSRLKKRLRSASETDSDHLPMDPALMTERQQLAFLLRATAHEASSSEGGGASSGSDSERELRAPKRARAAATASLYALDRPGVVIYCGRGRPPKNAIKLPPGHPHLRARLAGGNASLAASRAHKKAETAALPRIKTEHTNIKCEAQDDDDAKPDADGERNPSPSSVSDVGQLDAAAAPPCALCGDPRAPVDATAPLFLCPACDQKYPTQQALGRVCMI